MKNPSPTFIVNEPADDDTRDRNGFGILRDFGKAYADYYAKQDAEEAAKEGEPDKDMKEETTETAPQGIDQTEWDRQVIDEAISLANHAAKFRGSMGANEAIAQARDIVRRRLAK